jgi:hypothetical protein
MAITMKNVVFWNMILCGSCKNGRFIGNYRVHHQGGRNQHSAKKYHVTVFLCGVLRLLVTVNDVPRCPILFTLMMEVIRSSVSSVLTRTTLCYIPEGSILYRHCREDLKTYNTVSNCHMHGVAH